MSSKKIGYRGTSYDDDFDLEDDYYRTPTKDYSRGKSTSIKTTPSYGGSYGKSSYGTGYSSSYRSNWNWNPYSFNFDLTEDDDSDLFVNGHDNYFTPKASDIKDKLWGKGGASTTENVNLIKELSRFFYYRMVEEKSYMNEKFIDDSLLTDDLLDEKSKKVPFYEELWDKYIPGYTPLEKAMALFTELLKKTNSKDSSKENVADLELKSIIDDVKFEEGIYGDPIYNELLDSSDFGKRFKNEIFNKISLIKNLGSQFKIQKDIEEKIVQNSELNAKKTMRNYSQVHQIDLHQRLMPTFKSNLATKNLTITVPIDKTEHKQKIIMLLDYSGSMHNNEKQQWVLAILVDRLKYAMEEEAEVFFSYFLDKVSYMNFTHIYDRKSALKFWSSFSTAPSGGDTCIGDMINAIGKSINEGQLMNLNINLSEDKPEILVINDGQLA